MQSERWRTCTELFHAALERAPRSEEHTSELQSQSNLVCRLLLEKKKYTRRSSGAILLTSVPATIITSAWRWLGRNTTPYRSKSSRAAPACINSTAQHPSSNVTDPI